MLCQLVTQCCVDKEEGGTKCGSSEIVLKKVKRKILLVSGVPVTHLLFFSDPQKSSVRFISPAFLFFVFLDLHDCL